MPSVPAIGKLPALVALGVLFASLGACQSRRTVDTTGSIGDVRVRHPYVLADGTRSLDVFPTGPGHLDPRQAADVEAFAVEYRRYGRGTIVMDVPQGGAPGQISAARRTAASVRRLGAESGIASGAFVVTSYAVADPALASPVRLSFQRMEAKVASQCGLWPRALGTSDFTADVRNEPSWNFGCASRSNMAAQVADPVDLVRGREPGRIDTVRRSQVINDLRQGKDPSTEWKQDGKAKVKDQVN